jgi:hypothetical protein
MPLAREEVVAYIGNIKSANNSKVSYCPIVWNYYEVEACHIIVDEIWRDHSPEVEEVGVDFFDLLPHSLENSWLHFVVVPSKLLTIEFLCICVVLVELTLISNHLHSLAGRCGVATTCRIECISKVIVVGYGSCSALCRVVVMFEGLKQYTCKHEGCIHDEGGGCSLV